MPAPLSAALPAGPVLGVDPGSRRTGWGVVERREGRLRLVAAGVIRSDTDAPMPERLATLHAGLAGVIAAHTPAAAAIEAIFAHRSAASAIVLGQARGVALLALAQAGLTVHEYNASTVKRTVGGSGRADKDEVARMVAMLLGGAVPGPADATDALAIAMTHAAHGAAGAPPRSPTPRAKARGWSVADLAAAKARTGRD